MSQPDENKEEVAKLLKQSRDIIERLEAILNERKPGPEPKADEPKSDE